MKEKQKTKACNHEWGDPYDVRDDGYIIFCQKCTKCNIEHQLCQIEFKQFLFFGWKTADLYPVYCDHYNWGDEEEWIGDFDEYRIRYKRCKDCGLASVIHVTK